MGGDFHKTKSPDVNDKGRKEHAAPEGFSTSLRHFGSTVHEVLKILRATCYKLVHYINSLKMINIITTT